MTDTATAGTSPPIQLIATRPDGTLPPAPATMEAIWPRITDLLAHQRMVQRDEAAVQSQQYGMIRDGCVLMPPIFAGRQEDVCRRSWFHEYQFYFEFDSGTDERYFWVTTQLDRGYGLDALWFPKRRVAIANSPPIVDAARLERFAAMLSHSVPKPVWAAPPDAIPRLAVHGFQHLMHMMWNQLPALDRLASRTLPDPFTIAVHCEPFGPTAALYPELAPLLRPVRYEDMASANAGNGLVFGLGSWTITPGAQDRVRLVARDQTAPDAADRRDRFKASHHPVFWLSVKPPKRTMADQAETLACLIEALRGDYPGCGVILDGASLPWDFPGNSNYPPWFHAVSEAAVSGSAAIIDAVLARLDPALHRHMMALNNVSACEEVVWGEAASFYICHGGTMQNKIGWIHRVPGFIHSNRMFLRYARTMPPPVQDGPPCFYASDALIVDDDPRNYSSFELARKDQNYRFASIPALIAEIRSAVGGLGIA